MSKPQDNEPRRSLWEVMGHGDSDEQSSDADRAEGRSEDESTVEAVSEPDGEAAASESLDDRPRGLWAVMQNGPADAPATVDESEESDGESAADQISKSSEVDDEESDERNDAEGDSEETSLLSDDDEEDGWDVEDPERDLDAVGDLIPESPPEERLPERFSRSTLSAAVGVASVLLAGLTLLPGFLVRIPATLAGIVALLLGYHAVGNSRRDRSRNSPPPTALAGMTLGLLGIFAGPMYLNQLGESLRTRSTNEVATERLSAVHTSLDQYALEQGGFPSGGRFAPGEDGLEVARESWMTSLLPYLNYLELHDMIDHNAAWDSEANHEALAQQIPEFLMPNVEHEPNARGFATTHFAGVGGQIQTAQGILPIGVFEKNSDVSPNAITDGKSQTIVVGEIARALPSWGDPENWRTVEGGLNKRLSSFGNPAGTGAYFLFADGSVKFLSDRTSQKVLESLATRNASD